MLRFLRDAAATLVLGKGWCSYGCFFGGIEEGFASIAKKPRWKNLDPRWRWMSWAVQQAIGAMGLKVHPSFSGGAVSHVVARPGYRILVYERVGRTTPWQRVAPSRPVGFPLQDCPPRSPTMWTWTRTVSRMSA